MPGLPVFCGRSLRPRHRMWPPACLVPASEARRSPQFWGAFASASGPHSSLGLEPTKSTSLPPPSTAVQGEHGGCFSPQAGASSVRVGGFLLLTCVRPLTRKRSPHSSSTPLQRTSVLLEQWAPELGTGSRSGRTGAKHRGRITLHCYRRSPASCVPGPLSPWPQRPPGRSCLADY